MGEPRSPSFPRDERGGVDPRVRQDADLVGNDQKRKGIQCARDLEVGARARDTEI